MKRFLAIWRLLTQKYYTVVTWDDSSKVWVLAQYREFHKKNELINDIIESIWKQEYNKK